METKIQITCQCGYEQHVKLLPHDELYQCEGCGKQLFRSYVVNDHAEEESPPKLTDEGNKQELSQEKKDLMKEYQVTEEELHMIESEITNEDRDFYEGILDIEILRKKLWEYKNW